MDRSNFAAWCIVSSPLILGHDLTDETVMDKIWPIITNRHAINISQSFAPSLHPGGLVRTWSPSNAPTAKPNKTTQYVWALNSDPATTSGWSVPAPGVPGYVKHRAAANGNDGAGEEGDDDETELCLSVPSAGRNKGKVLLCPCMDNSNSKSNSGSNPSGCVAPNQTWVHEANGSLVYLPSRQQTTILTSSMAHDHDDVAAAASGCLVLANGRGPSVELFRCKPGGNERFTFDPVNGSLCSALVRSSTLLCWA